jgi:hypothetical protein
MNSRTSDFVWNPPKDVVDGIGPETLSMQALPRVPNCCVRALNLIGLP